MKTISSLTIDDILKLLKISSKWFDVFKNHPNRMVRLAICKQNNYFDQYVNDKDIYIREHIALTSNKYHDILKHDESVIVINAIEKFQDEHSPKINTNFGEIFKNNLYKFNDRK